MQLLTQDIIGTSAYNAISKTPNTKRKDSVGLEAQGEYYGQAPGLLPDCFFRKNCTKLVYSGIEELKKVPYRRLQEDRKNWFLFPRSS